MNTLTLTVGSFFLGVLVGFFVAANNPDEAGAAKGFAGRALNALRRLVVNIKAGVSLLWGELHNRAEKPAEAPTEASEEVIPLAKKSSKKKKAVARRQVR